MTEQVRASRHVMTQAQQDEAAEATRNAPPTERSAETEETLAHSDELLDEIDEILETNAEAFVKGYVQKGGE